MFTKIGDLLQNILHGPIEAAVGLIGGIIWGFISGHVPHHKEVSKLPSGPCLPLITPLIRSYNSVLRILLMPQCL